MTKKVVSIISPAEVPAQMKDRAIGDIASSDEVGEALKTIAILKVVLLADVGCDGGLNKDNRRRAWKMVADLGMLLMEKDSD